MIKVSDKRSVRTLILVMGVLVVIGILIAKSYYSDINNSVDPRIKPARMAYNEYNKRALKSDFTGVLSILDSIQHFYAAVPHYQNSYEIGVAHVNRSAVYLTVGLHIDSLRVNHNLGPMATLTKKGLLDRAEEELLQGISFYKTFDSVYGKIEKDNISDFIREDFFSGLENYTDKDRTKFLESRTKEIETAQWENVRRLSVAYTNLGTVWYHREDFNKAGELYKEALELWEDNLNAENNLNSMLGRPLKKRSFLRKLFPKSRKD